MAAGATHLGRQDDPLLGVALRARRRTTRLMESGRPDRSSRRELMSVFALRCRQCGELVDIPGRFGFKLKNSGIDSTICQRCRQQKFLRERDWGQSLTTSLRRGERRWIPALAITIAIAIIGVGITLQRRSPEPTPTQDTTSAADLSK